MDSENNQRKETLRQAKILFASGQLEKSVTFFSLAEKHGKDLPEIWMSRGGRLYGTG